MKKLGIIMSVIIATVSFIYALSLISVQNTCTGVRSYECQKKIQEQTLQTASSQTEIPQDASNHGGVNDSGEVLPN